MDFHVSFIMLMDLRLFLNCFSPHSTHSTFTIYLYASKCTYVPVWLPIMPRVHMHTQPNAIVNHLFPFILFALSLSSSLSLCYTFSLTLTPCTHTHIYNTHFLFFPYLWFAILCYVRDFPESNQTANRKNTVFGNHIVYLTNIFERLKNHIFQIVYYIHYTHAYISYKNRCFLTNFQQLYKIENIT